MASKPALKLNLLPLLPPISGRASSPATGAPLKSEVVMLLRPATALALACAFIALHSAPARAQCGGLCLYEVGTMDMGASAARIGSSSSVFRGSDK